MSDINISSNWVTAGEESLNKVITCCSTDTEEYDIDNLTADSCVCLKRPENESTDSPAFVEIESKNFLKQIVVFSEGNLIEVFGIYNEYLCSCVSQLIDDWDGMAVFHSKIVLPEITKCRLKFNRTKDKNRLWIYSIQLTISQSTEPSKEIFNFDNVNKIISNSSQQISEKAEKFKKFLEIYLRNSSQLKNYFGQSVDLQMLLNMMNKNQDFQMEIFKKNSPTRKDSKSKESSVERLHQENGIVEFLKSYIDEKFVKMKEEISETFEKKFDEFKNENNAKLDKIIGLLSSLKT